MKCFFFFIFFSFFLVSIVTLCLFSSQFFIFSFFSFSSPFYYIDVFWRYLKNVLYYWITHFTWSKNSHLALCLVTPMMHCSVNKYQGVMFSQGYPEWEGPGYLGDLMSPCFKFYLGVKAWLRKYDYVLCHTVSPKSNKNRPQIAGFAHFLNLKHGLVESPR